MIKAIIIDDEVHCIDTLSILLADYCPEAEVIDKCLSAKKGLQAIEKMKPDLVFLDIEMPVMNGFEMLEQIKVVPFSIIFTTSYDQYAIKAIRFSALDYLLKPVDPKELIAAVHKVQLQKAVPSAEQYKVLMEQIQGRDGGLQKARLRLDENDSFKNATSLKRRLAAILFTDIVGYTAIMQQDETKALAVMKRYTMVLEHTVAAHAGEVLNDYGDGSLCVFYSAAEAVLCGLKIQQQLQKEPAIQLRIGIHLGEIFFEGGKIMGDGVNIASHIQSIATGNSILFSEEIQDKIKNLSKFSSVSLGSFEFKNVQKPVIVFALANEGLQIPARDAMDGKLKKKPVSDWMKFFFRPSE